MVGEDTGDAPRGPSPGPLSSIGFSGQSTQSKVRVTAFFHWAYSLSRRPASICGVHSLSLTQFSRRSSTCAQNPVASPAA